MAKSFEDEVKEEQIREDNLHVYIHKPEAKIDPKTFRRKLIRRMVEHHIQVEDIGKVFKLTPMRVYQILKKIKNG